MSKASYLIMAIFFGCLAAVVFIERDRVDFHLFRSVLRQRETRNQAAKSSYPENIAGSEEINDHRSKLKTNRHGESQSSNDEVKSTSKLIRQSPKDGDRHVKQDNSATSTKEQHIRKGASVEEKKGDDERTANRMHGHMKQLGKHGSIISEGKIEELYYVPNGKDFYQHFLRKRQPLIMRSAIINWPAVKYWANESYLEEKYGHVIFDVQLTKKYEGEFPAKKTMNLTEFLDIYKSKQVYLDCPFPHSDMIQDIFIPYCLQCEEIMKTIASTHLLFSSGNTSSSCHMDGYENLLSVISGTKEILVADPNYVEYFYPRNHTTVNIESPIDPEAVDLQKFPKLAEIPFHKVVLNAGDILYIPQHWWHHVRSYDCPNIAISLWFHPFAEKEDSEEQLDMEDETEDTSLFEDVVYSTKVFRKIVETYPETIKCQSQNKLITEAFHPDDLGTPEEDMFVTLSSGYKMPKLGFGTAGLFEDTKSSVLVALNAGYRMIDSAQAYNEEHLGLALEESGLPREDIFIVSKVHPRFLGYHETLQSVEESLKKLKVSYVDLMLIHSMDCDEGPGAHLVCPKGEPNGTWVDSWKALESLVEKGKIRSIGVSNFEVEDLQRLLEIAHVHPSVVQNFFDPFSQDSDTRQFCKENNIQYMAHSTLGDSWKREGLPENPVFSDEGLRKIATRFDASIAQLVIKWCLEHTICVPRSRNPNHIQTNFHLFHVVLNDQDREYFENLDGKIIVPDDGPPFDSRSKGRIPDQDVASTEEPYHGSANSDAKNINDKVVLIEKVDLQDPTLYLSSDDHWIYAFDAATGKVKWKYGTADEGGSKCAFNSDGTVVYCGTDDKSLRALYAANGSLIWKFSTGGAITSSTRVGPDGSLYFGCLDGHFYSVNPDGSLKWKQFLGEEIWSSPALLSNGETLFIGSMAEDSANVFALKSETGEIMWESGTKGSVFSSPTVSHDDKTVFFCSFDANCYAFSTENGKELWVFQADSAFQSSPVVSKADGTMFVGSSEGNIYAVDSFTGKVKWTREGKGELFSSPFIAPDGHIFVGSGKGEVLALRQADGSLVWSFKTESAVWSSPRLDKSGVLFIGGIDTYLYALRSESGQLVWKYKTEGAVVGTPLITREHALEQA
ncbi:uncharacterized protein [Montipora capricornis]|uniref:uncharacterized protein isoform X1 n=1 Tax=Montipora capricornis TaxID=246305 RepID=UPI0035F1B00A